jgi:acyl-lipid omega-6 desaturase (Delta-12 desaturase)
MPHSSSSQANPLPSLSAVRGVIPPELLRADDRKATLTLIRVAVALALAEAFTLALWASGAWPLLPFAWLTTGTVLFAVFEVMHACGHQGFVRSRRGNTILGHLTALPLLFPFTQWKLWHDAHHRRPNVLGQTLGRQLVGRVDLSLDTAFTPLEVSELRPRPRGLGWLVDRASRSAAPLMVILLPVLLSLRIGTALDARNRRRCAASLAFTGAAGALLAAGITHLAGPWGVVHLWLAPLAFFAAWLGYYSFVQHTAPDLPNLRADEWTPAHQLATVVNTEVPRPIAWLHGGGVYHAIHHVAPTIAGYHLAAANAAVMASPYAPLIRTAPFSLSRLWALQRRCQVWDAEARVYRTFRDILAEGR